LIEKLYKNMIKKNIVKMSASHIIFVLV